MSDAILIDTGPIVAYLDRAEEHHEWAREQIAKLSHPFLTCDAVIAEAWFLVSKTPQGTSQLVQLLQRKIVTPLFHLDKELQSVTELLLQYRNIKTSLADTCLVRMSELYSNSVVFTIDSDFRIYRKNKRQAIPVLMP